MRKIILVENPLPSAAARPATAPADDDDDIETIESGSSDDDAKPALAPPPRAPLARRRVSSNGVTAALDLVKLDKAAATAACPPPPAVDDGDDAALAHDLPLYALRRVFHLPSFRPSQRDVVDAVLAGRDVFVLMPTGGGKSLCYQLPAVVSAGLTVVVSPLLSLVQDQVAALLAAPCGGVPAASLSSALPESARRAVLRELDARAPTLKLLYVTPEQLVKNQGLVDRLASLDAAGRLARIVVDEAHCVSAW